MRIVIDFIQLPIRGHYGRISTIISALLQAQFAQAGASSAYPQTLRAVWLPLGAAFFPLLVSWIFSMLGMLFDTERNSEPKSMKHQQLAWLKKNLVHPARTTSAAVLSLLAARVVGLPEVYWAPISTMIVMQSTLGAALTISWQRWVGTALGSAAGALLATCFGPSLIAFGVGVFGVGLLCGALRLDKPAYRFAGITLTVVVLVAHAEPVWVTAIHRFTEVSLGIAVGLVATALWPE
jgi:uncharacterized membrane protein YccC